MLVYHQLIQVFWFCSIAFVARMPRREVCCVQGIVSRGSWCVTVPLQVRLTLVSQLWRHLPCLSIVRLLVLPSKLINALWGDTLRLYNILFLIKLSPNYFSNYWQFFVPNWLLLVPTKGWFSNSVIFFTFIIWQSIVKRNFFSHYLFMSITWEQLMNSHFIWWWIFFIQ